MLVAEITQNDITYGLRMVPDQCALAESLKNKFDTALVHVSKKRIIIYTLTGPMVYTHSPESFKFVEDYDLGRLVEPTKVRLFKAIKLCGYSFSPAGMVVALLWGMQILRKNVKHTLINITRGKVS